VDSESPRGTYLAWGERGLVGTFLLDLCQLPLSIVTEFLRSTEFPGAPVFASQYLTSFKSILEPDFSNTGFGHPDAILIGTFDSDRILVIVEAKRTSLEQASQSCCNRGSEKFNSCLNGQLELNYCLTRALSKFKAEDTELVEPNWILSTPYNKERKGRLRSLKKGGVLRTIVDEIAGVKLKECYHLIVTNEPTNPFDVCESSMLPELFEQVLDEDGDWRCENRWSNLRSQFGWINYDRIEKFIRDHEGELATQSFFLPSYELNSRNMRDSSAEPPEPELSVPPEPGNDPPPRPPQPAGIGDYHLKLKDLWTGPSFSIVPGSVGYSAKFRGIPRLWVFPNRFEVMSEKRGNTSCAQITTILRKYFSNVQGSGRVYFTSHDFSWEKLVAFVDEVKKCFQSGACR